MADHCSWWNECRTRSNRTRAATDLLQTTPEAAHAVEHAGGDELTATCTSVDTRGGLLSRERPGAIGYTNRRAAQLVCSEPGSVPPSDCRAHAAQPKHARRGDSEAGQYLARQPHIRGTPLPGVPATVQVSNFEDEAVGLWGWNGLATAAQMTGFVEFSGLAPTRHLFS